MFRSIWNAFNESSKNVTLKILGIYLILAAANLGAWIWALAAFHDFPVLLGTALLAYSFGLRHAVDADHIAAIDNVTLKLIQEGERPVTVGFYFSLGHSTVVVLASVAIAATANALQNRFDALRQVGGLIGTSMSTLFLIAIAAVNALALLAAYRSFQAARRGERPLDDDINAFLSKRGLLGRLFRPLFRLIGKSWHMYPLGFLFGLGFDTATEVGLLGISAAETAKGLPIWTILVFPALFTAGMSLIDTTDSILMLGTYKWTVMKPIRRLYYNMTVTFVSVVVALAVGGIEALGLISSKLGLEGRFWSLIGLLNDNFASLGFLIVGVFIASWIVSVLVYRVGRFDELEGTGGD